MKGFVTVETPEQFGKWLTDQAVQAAAEAAPAAAQAAPAAQEKKTS
jgi:heme/copper-type cytochrome/quinol oxidase subunit 2